MSKFFLGFSAGLFCTMATALHAQSSSSGTVIIAAVSGNTISGVMAASGSFEEFFSADGQIRANGYFGQWKVDGNTLCLSYDGDPPSCWQLIINGSSVIWIGRSGEEGTATIIAGNPGGF